MSTFFDWIGEVTPLLVWFFLWACIAPIRIALLLILPKNAERRYHWANSTYNFLAFERN